MPIARNKITEHPIISGAVLLFIGWAASLFIPQSRDWWVTLAKRAGDAIASGWWWLWSPLSVPRLVVAIASVLALAYVTRRLLSSFRSAAADERREPAELRGLTDAEKKVPQMLAAADGSVVWFNQIQHALGSSKLKAKHTITMLRARMRKIIRESRAVSNRRSRRSE